MSYQQHIPYAVLAVAASSLLGWTWSEMDGKNPTVGAATTATAFSGMIDDSENDGHNNGSVSSSNSSSSGRIVSTSNSHSNKVNEASSRQVRNGSGIIYQFLQHPMIAPLGTLMNFSSSSLGSPQQQQPQSPPQQHICHCQEQQTQPLQEDKKTSNYDLYNRTKDALLRKRRTLIHLEETKTAASVESRYEWDKDLKVGEGAYSRVYRATKRDETKETVALKEIAKQYTDSSKFQQEMEAMLYIQQRGGHPHVIGLHEHFDSADSYILILDFIQGGELFDHLIDTGAYSELDASRIIREVASALNFLHGIGVVHADLKPENILLSTTRRGDSKVKVADFGTAVLVNSSSDDGSGGFGGFDGNPPTTPFNPVYGAPTPAYCPPEAIQKTSPIQPSMDMWALGVVLFIMLTGCHPFDISGDSTDEQIEARIKDRRYRVPLHRREIAGHISQSAKDLIERLMHRNPSRRLTAYEMLQHPWVRGETASKAVIAGSDERLKVLRGFKSRIQRNFFENAVKWSESHDPEDGNTRSKTSLIERSFKELDAEKRGFLTHKEIMGSGGNANHNDSNMDIEEGGGPAINMTDFENLLSENLINKYYPAGHTVYVEGAIGNSMYFLESGTVEVIADGTRAVRNNGDFFGEGALLHKSKMRSATVRCLTPVHVLEISREYFEKYISSSETSLYLTLREKDSIRKRNRARTILRMQQGLETVEKPYRSTFFKEGDEGDSMFILEKGTVNLEIKGKLVMSAYPGNVFGEHSVMTGWKRNCDAKCATWEGCTARTIEGDHFRQLLDSSPHLQQSMRELQLRREFKKAVVRRMRKEFPYQHIEKAFEAADEKGLGSLDTDAIAKLMRELNPEYTDEDIQEMMRAFDLTDSGTVTFDEVKKALVGDVRAAASM
jgi:serine/threonine protein kinase